MRTVSRTVARGLAAARRGLAARPWVPGNTHICVLAPDPDDPRPSSSLPSAAARPRLNGIGGADGERDRAGDVIGWAGSARPAGDRTVGPGRLGGRAGPSGAAG